MKIAGVTAFVLLVRIGNAQEPVTIRTETNAVQVDVTVRDSKGQIVADLTRQDFQVKDDGKPREIAIFSFNRTAMPDAGSAPAAAGVTANVRPLPANIFTNLNSEPPPAAAHSTVILLDGANGWFDNFVWARQAVIDLLGKIPADERIAVYAVAKFQGLVLVQEYTNNPAPQLENDPRRRPCEPYHQAGRSLPHRHV